MDACLSRRLRRRRIGPDWLDLPGWYDDHVAELWPALQRSCEKPAPEWTRLCDDLRRTAPVTDAAARDWLQKNLRPYRVEALDATPEGLVTGYFEPLVDGSRTSAFPNRTSTIVAVLVSTTVF